MLVPTDKKRESEQPSWFYRLMHNPLVLAAMTAAPAAGAYWLSRRPQSLKGLTAEQVNTAKSMRQHGVGIDVSPKEVIYKEPWKNYLRWGTPHVRVNDQYGDFKHWDSSPVRTVISPTSTTSNTQNTGRFNVVGLAKGHPSIGNKLEEANLFNQYAPGAMAASRPITVPADYNHPVGDRIRIREGLAKLQQQLKTDWGDTPYILKNMRGAASGSGLLTHQEDLPKLWDSIASTTPENYDPVQKYRYHELKHLAHNPGTFFAQEKLPLQQTGAADNLISKILGRRRSPTNEYRVHAIGNEVIPASVARYSPITQAMNNIGIRTPELRHVEDYVKQTLAKLPSDYTNNRTFAFDVGITPNGPRIIESNPSTRSGFLFGMNERPDVQTQVNEGVPGGLLWHRTISHLQRQNTPVLAGLDAARAGAIGTGLYAGGRLLSNTLEPDQDKEASATHDAPAVKVTKRDHDVWICPHCGEEILEKSLYKDAKGWWFHRPCFAKGKGSIKLPDKQAADGSLGSNPISGQTSNDPPRPLNRDGSSPSGDQNSQVFDISDLAHQVAQMVAQQNNDVGTNQGIEMTGQIHDSLPAYQDGAKPMDARTLTNPNSHDTTHGTIVDGAGFSAQPPLSEDFSVDLESSTPSTGQRPHLSM